MQKTRVLHAVIQRVSSVFDGPDALNEPDETDGFKINRKASNRTKKKLVPYGQTLHFLERTAIIDCSPEGMFVEQSFS
jgi:hypothetical protein